MVNELKGLELNSNANMVDAVIKDLELVKQYPNHPVGDLALVRAEKIIQDLKELRGL